MLIEHSAAPHRQGDSALRRLSPRPLGMRVTGWSRRAGLLLLLWVPLPCELAAQGPVHVRGRVVDGGSGEPLLGVAVAGGIAIVETSQSGSFAVTVRADTSTLVFSRIGYASLSLRAGDVPAEVRLRPDAVLLNGLTVVVPSAGAAAGLSVQRIERARVAAHAAHSVSEVLEGLEGLAVSRPGTWGASMSLRGLGGERVAVLVDGNRVERACTFGMDQQVATVDPATVQSVEIVAGPGSALVGSGSLGGVVSLVTTPPPIDRRVSGAVRLGTASATPGITAGASIQARGRRLNGSLALDARKLGDYRAPDGPVGGSGFRDGSVRTQLGFERAAGERLSSSMSWYEGRDIGWPAMPGASIPRERRRSISLDHGRQLGGKLDAVASHAYLQRLDHHMVLSMPASGGTSTTDAQSRSAVAGARVQLRLVPLAALQVETGVEATRWAAEATRWVERTNATGVTGPRTVYRTWPAVRILDAGAFSQGELRLGERVVGTIGARADRVFRRAEGQASSTEWVPTGNLGLRTTLAGALTARASLGIGYRVPDPTELFGLAPRPDGFIYRGNPALSTETGRNMELSLRYASGAVVGSITGFRNNLQGLITSVVQPDSINGRPVRSYVNLPHARITGLTASARWQPAGWAVLSGTLSGSRGERRPDGAPLPAIAPLQGIVGVRLQQTGAASWVELEAAGAARQERVARAAGEVVTPAWSTLAVTVGRTIGGSTLVAGIENLLNGAYRAHLDPVRVIRPGRNLFVRLERQL